LPYYKKAESGKLDIEIAKKEYEKLIKELSKTYKNIKLTQTEFQKLVGRIEVLGELIIKSK